MEAIRRNRHKISICLERVLLNKHLIHEPRLKWNEIKHVGTGKFVTIYLGACSCGWESKYGANTSSDIAISYWASHAGRLGKIFVKDESINFD